VWKEHRPLSGRQGIVMARKKKLPAMTEFQTVKRIDNSRIVRHSTGEDAQTVPHGGRWAG